MTAPAVLTLVKNREPHLHQLVEGLRRSTTVPAELIVVDMSDDPVTLPPLPFPARVIRHAGRGLPLAAARNLAAAATAAEHLVFLDVDCIPLDGCLARLVETLAAEDALLCADVRYLGPDDARGPWTQTDLLAAGAPHPARDFPAAGHRREHDPGLFWSLAFAVRARRFRALGGFDEAFTGYGGEDTDLGLRAAAAGVPLLFVGGAIACHQWHESEDPPVRHLADIVRNARLFHAKHGWWPMHGWLRAFRDRGLVRWTDDSLVLVDDDPVHPS
ncbi:glycosyltransferase family 2 protein [Sphingomonas rubra]|uniref:Glycosyltransferase, GT2 family n=1 Tax=Sphingomonas rubra TaxID=634430 RepID=A0A1I5PK38_9SPHN|nr:glycosyltransferase [Sphingomonas rubra]SFP33906.1 Glycosyltransferase, GT2 family [Sphingomonas rubra]